MSSIVSILPDIEPAVHHAIQQLCEPIKLWNTSEIPHTIQHINTTVLAVVKRQLQEKYEFPDSMKVLVNTSISQPGDSSICTTCILDADSSISGTSTVTYKSPSLNVIVHMAFIPCIG